MLDNKRGLDPAYLSKTRMFKNLKILFFIFSFIFLGEEGRSFACDGPVVRVGLVAYTYNGKFTTYIKHEDAMQQHLPKMLKQHLPEICFDIRQYRQSDVKKLIEEGKIDLFLGSSGFYWEMRKYGARDLATFVSSFTPNPNHGNAGVIFSRKDRDDIQSLVDCRRKVLAGGTDSQFQAHLLSLREFVKQGLEPENFFSKIIHNDLPLKDVVKQIREGVADVGFLRACVLETMYPGWENEFKILNKQNNSDMFCEHSTTQYPNATLAALPSLLPEYSRKIAGVLLSAEPNGPAQYHWSLTTDYGSVDNLYKELKLGPYLYLREWTAKDFLKKTWPFISIFVVILVCLCVHLWRVETLVQKRTRLLTREVANRREAERSALLSEKRANQLQHSAIVGQLSSILAHELRQPLTVIQNYKDSIDLLLSKNKVNNNKFEYCSIGIQKQVEKIDQLVKKVRSYAKTDSRRDELINLSELTSKIGNEIQNKLLPKGVSFKTNITRCVKVRGDPLELELLVRNILKNAEEAVDSNRDLVSLTLKQLDSKCVLKISNTGEKFSEDQVKEFCEPFVSYKSEGLGLGIVISKAIVEAHYGSIRFIPRETGGLTVEINFPLWDKMNEV